MSLYDYEIGRGYASQDPPFYALIQAAMRGADTHNAALLRNAFPSTWGELQARYNAPGGLLAGETSLDELAQIVAERIAGEWATAHGTLTGPREASLVEHVLNELAETSLDDLRRRWTPS